MPTCASSDASPRYGCPVVDVVDCGTDATVVLSGGQTVATRYVVGCDGGSSTIRTRGGFVFPGSPPTMTGRTAVATLAEPAPVSSLRAPGGLVNLSLVDGEIATIEFDGGPEDRDAPVTAEELQASIRRVSGTDATVTGFQIGIRYSDNTRLADTYRSGRILLAGDAAHVHSPIGGQGLNLGLQDAMNLGWKLGRVVRDDAPESLLDTYTAERRPVAERVLDLTRAQVALMRPGPQVDALRALLGELLTIPAVRHLLMSKANGTDIAYPPADLHPPAGRFAPDDLLRQHAEPLRAGHGVPVDIEGAALWIRPDGYLGHPET